MSTDPRTLIDRLEAAAALPAGSTERFNGYGVMGLPFRAGHVLAMRRFLASSVGPGYTSVWHRTPGGDWCFYADVPPRQACTRYFGASAMEAVQTEIALQWTAPFRMRITIPSVPLEWEIEAAPTAATRVMTTMARLLPEAAWHSPAVLSAMSMLAGPLLSAGHLGLHGQVPNGQHFVANPRVVWAVVRSHARFAGQDLGEPGPVQPQARLGDFWIPQRGLLAIGQAYFDVFDPAVHSVKTSRAPTASV